MKINNIFKGVLLSAFAFMAAVGLTSCQDEPDKYEVTSGNPTIRYIRPVDVAAADSLITGAYMGNSICLVGENLRSIKHLLFNDQEANLNSSFITDNTAIVQVPSKLPNVVLNKMFFVNEANDTTSYDFKVLVPGPTISTMTNEWAQEGEEVVIKGNYFIQDPNVPLTLFINGTPVKIDSYDMNTLEFVMPGGLTEGPIEVQTVYGKGKAKFNYKDSRGLITDFDGEWIETSNGPMRSSSVNGITPQGWNLKTALSFSTEGGIDGNYAQVGPAALSEDGGWQENLKLSFWCGNWNGDPMSIKTGPGTPIRNALPAGYFKDPSSLALKFELCIPKNNSWKSGALQVLFVNNKQCANDAWQNNTYIHTSASGGLDLCRGIYRPWESTGEFHTNGKWITVTMPLSEFVHNMDGTPGAVALSEESFDSFIMWPISGGVKGKECEPILRYDNIRIIPIK